MTRTFLTDTSPDHNFFYVSAIDGARHVLMAGPYGSHDEAKDMVTPVRLYCSERDGRAHWMAWGTAGSSDKAESRLGPIAKPALIN